MNQSIRRTATTRASETHFDVLFWVLQVLEQRVFAPDDSTLFVGSGVRVAVRLSGLPTKKSIQIRPLLVWATLLDSVALRALGLENLGSLFFTHDGCSNFLLLRISSCGVRAVSQPSEVRQPSAQVAEKTLMENCRQQVLV